MKILLLGSKGQLGRCIEDQLNDDIISFSRDEVDITDFKKIKKKIKSVSPDIIVNSAAFTAVDLSEKESATANTVNYLAVKNLAKICKEIGSYLIHISTDYVFDGTSKVPYTENDKKNPQNTYGVTKLKGELAIQNSGCNYLILRVAWVFSEYGNNFLTTMLNIGKNKGKIDVVNDQIGCPTYAQDIAKAIKKIIYDSNFKNNTKSLYHFCGNQPCSWYDFAKIIFEEAGIRNLPVPISINKIKTSQYPYDAKRPAFSILDCTKISDDFNIDQSDWKSGIIKSINRILS